MACSGLSCPANSSDQPDRELEAEWAVPDASADPPLPAKVACGIGSCLPENESACEGYEPPASSSDEDEDEERDDPETEDADELADAGSGDAGALDAGADAMSLLDAGDAGAPTPALDGSFVRPPPVASGPREYACQLMLTPESSVARGCSVAGTQGVGEACTSSRDCDKGLGCVGMMHSGRCLPYCCAIDGDTCGGNSYCAERPLRDESLGLEEGPLVPVCVRADACSLGEAYPCEGRDCVCGPDTACTVVRSDGTTTCLKPGASGPGEKCEPVSSSSAGVGNSGCQAGYLCAQSADEGTCVKICDLDEPNCSPGVCQANAALPTGWGTCVGVSPVEMTSQ